LSPTETHLLARGATGGAGYAGDEWTMLARRARILVVEDEALVGLMIEAMLADCGHEPVGPVHNLAEALAVLGARGVDAALLDLGLQDGLSVPIAQALGRLRIPFGIVTGFSPEFAARLLPGRPILAKPFRESDLEGLVSRLLAEADAPATLTA
jgi:DNA-binding response OmpR family regulator